MHDPATNLDNDSPSLPVALLDTPQLQRITFAPHKTNSITIKVTAVARGSVHDLCISELELYSGGKKIDMAMPACVRFTKGDEAYMLYDLIDRSGRVLARGSGDDLGDFGRWNPQGRLLADLRFNDDDCGCTFWIADAAAKRVVFRAKLAREVQEVRWVRDRVVRVTCKCEKDPLEVVVPEPSTKQGVWINVHAATPGLAGVRVQQFPDCDEDLDRYCGRHPAMILYVFKDGRVHQLGFEPDGKPCSPHAEDFWWRISNDSWLWSELDRSFATADK